METTQLGPDKVRAHTPDPTKYHQVDSIQASRGVRGTVIPRATREGASQGFNHQRAGTVNIIELGDDGEQRIGTLDIEQLNNQSVQRALQMSGGDPAGAYSALAQQQNIQPVLSVKVAEVEAPRLNPLMPGTYVVPSSTKGGSQMQPHEETQRVSVPLSPSVKPSGAPLARVAAMPLSPEIQRSTPPAAQPAAVPAIDPNQFFQMMQALAGQQPVQQQAAPQVGDPFQQLGIGFLTAQPQRPSYKVFFNLGDAGSQVAHFHDVVLRDRCMFLVYDNRFEYGAPYVPPVRTPDNGNDPIQITISNQQSTHYNVYTPDVRFSWGCFDFVLLLVLAPERDSPVTLPEQAYQERNPTNEELYGSR